MASKRQTQDRSGRTSRREDVRWFLEGFLDEIEMALAVARVRGRGRCDVGVLRVIAEHLWRKVFPDKCLPWPAPKECDARLYSELFPGRTLDLSVPGSETPLRWREMWEQDWQRNQRRAWRTASNVSCAKSARISGRKQAGTGSTKRRKS